MIRVDGRDACDGGLSFLGIRRRALQGVGRPKCRGCFAAHRAFRNCDDAEAGAAFDTPPDRVGDRLDVVRDLRDQDDIRATGDPRPKGQPAGPIAHDLDDDDPVVAVGSAVEPVDGVGGDVQRGGEPE